MERSGSSRCRPRKEKVDGAGFKQRGCRSHEWTVHGAKIDFNIPAGRPSHIHHPEKLQSQNGQSPMEAVQSLEFAVQRSFQVGGPPFQVALKVKIAASVHVAIFFDKSSSHHFVYVYFDLYALVALQLGKRKG